MEVPSTLEEVTNTLELVPSVRWPYSGQSIRALRLKAELKRGLVKRYGLRLLSCYGFGDCRIWSCWFLPF